MNRRPERIGDLLPGVLADLAARHHATNGASPMPNVIEHLLTVAGDALYADDRVRWVLDEDGRTVVVLKDGRSFVLRLESVELGGAA